MSRVTDQLLLGVDIGTSSSKGVLTSTSGTVLARVTRPHQTSNPHPGWFEHDAEAIWWADFLHIVRELVAAAEGREIAGLAVSGIGPVLLPADADGRPLREAILYGVDTRATEEIAELTEEFGAEAILARGGTSLSSQAVGPKWRWLAKHEPRVYGETQLFLMASSFLVFRLTGEYVLDHHSASQCDPMYDLRRQEWATDWARRVAPGIELPRLAWSNEVVGHVTARAAELTGLPVGLPVTAGTVDAWAEAASVGVTDPGDTMVMYGTTMFLVQVLSDPSPHAGLWSTRGTLPGTYTLAAGMATSGALTNWIRELVDGEFADLVAGAAVVPPGSRGLLLLPYFAGERTPIFDPSARGVIAGLTTGHGVFELYRAALEGIAHGVRHNLEAMHEAGGVARRLIAVGGGTQGDLWTQIVTDVTGVEQQIPGETIGAALGDALFAGLAVGAVSPELAIRWNPVARTIRPDAERHREYSEYYDMYRKLYPATTEVTHFLAARQRSADAG